MIRKKAIIFALVFIVFLSPLHPAAAQRAILVEVQFKSLKQGTLGVIILNGSDLTGAVTLTLDRAYPCYPTSVGFACLIAVPITQKISEYPLQITISYANGGSMQWAGTFKVVSGAFLTEPAFTMPTNKSYLLDQRIEQAENDRLSWSYSIITQARYWEGAFSLPAVGNLISPFGTVRFYTNDGIVRRHMGNDLKVGSGTPVLAAATGRVVLARLLDIHGNIVIIDHGWGVFTAYAHLSELYVVPGQFVLQGEMVAKSGNTGRSLGAHLHWEVSIGGIWVDPVFFMSLKLPN